MILSVDIRTDIPAFYSEWLLERFREGYVLVRNPFANGTVHKVILDNKHIECIMWTSKDYTPIMPHLDDIVSKFPSIFHYTITGYGKDIEPNVPGLEVSTECYRELSARYGKDHVAWRYDPILLWNDITLAWHLENFSNICEMLGDSCQKAIINFVHLYEKVKWHMGDNIEVPESEQEELVKMLIGIASQHGIELQACGSALKYTYLDGISKLSCINYDVLRLMGIWPKTHKPANSTFSCGCYPSTAIGAYNTCMHKCKYCYASSDFDECDKNFSMHDPKSPMLIGWPSPNDNIIEMKPKSIGTSQQEIEFTFE